jgi:hypothetical protein
VGHPPNLIQDRSSAVLDLDAICVQAKRWKDVVGSPEIMKFSGGLTKRHANRGVFITTSTFTKDALEFVKALPQKIVPIVSSCRMRRPRPAPIESRMAISQQRLEARANNRVRDIHGCAE